MDWAKYSACDACRGRRRFLFRVILPATLIVFAGILMLVRMLAGTFGK